jgi:hypothetical protein
MPTVGTVPLCQSGGGISSFARLNRVNPIFIQLKVLKVAPAEINLSTICVIFDDKEITLN